MKTMEFKPTLDNIHSLEAVAWFAGERELIRLAKEAGVPQEEWTSDPILREYRFCNIHRADDRVSRWIIDNLIAGNEKASGLWFTLLVARFINWPPSLQHLLDAGVLPASPQSFDGDKFVETMEALKASGAKTMTGAYTVNPGGRCADGKVVNKFRRFAELIMPTVFRAQASIEHELKRTDALLSVEGFTNAMTKILAVKTFMAGQVAADLTYLNAPLCDAYDLYSYAPIGPGSKAGLNRLRGEPLRNPWKQADFNKALLVVNNALIELRGINTLTLHDTQNVMCEFDKYARVFRGEGRPRSQYRPETSF